MEIQMARRVIRGTAVASMCRHGAQITLRRCPSNVTLTRTQSLAPEYQNALWRISLQTYCTSRQERIGLSVPEVPREIGERTNSRVKRSRITSPGWATLEAGEKKKIKTVDCGPRRSNEHHLIF
mmetsp:Transcript_64728/g.101913  ORF Transcript_64728/g.101913 Transcript_64728/m.101913 type:complete len:124 (-) Transcript_64728:169-540(-)